MRAPYRLFALLAWNPAAGMAIDPVGVLGVDEGSSPPVTYVSWVPLTYERAQPWRARLSQPPTAQMIANWLADDGGAQLTELTWSTNARSLGHAVEAALDTLLADVIPHTPRS